MTTALTTKTNFKTVEELVASFVARNKTLIEDMLTYAWDLGKEIQAIKNEAAYGDGALKKVQEGLGIKSDSTLYAYAQFYTAYPKPKDAIKLFAEKEIPFRTIYNKLLPLPDDIRSVVEEKIKSGEVDRDKLEEYLDDLKTKIKEAEENKKLEEENDSVADQRVAAEAPPEDVKWAKKIKLPFYKVTQACEKLTDAFHKSEAELQNMDMISDKALYESVVDIMQSQVEAVRAMFKVAEHWKDRVNDFKIPEEDDKKPEGK